MRRAAVAAVAISLCSCTNNAPAPAMDFARAHFYDAPFPSDDLRRGDGTIDLSKLPNPQNPTLIAQALQLLEGAHGFGLASAIYFRMGGAVDPKSLPSLSASATKDSPVLLMSVEPGAPDFLQPRPIEVAFMADGGPFGDKNLLALLPLQGVPLRKNERYVALLTRKIRDDKGRAIGRSPTLDALWQHQAVKGLSGAAYDEYMAALELLGPMANRSDIAAFTVFTTDDPTAQLAQVRDEAQAAHPILPPSSPFTLTDTFDDYCVYRSTVSVPVYQTGTSPYQLHGGNWTFDASGHAVYDHSEDAHLVVTIPRAPMPSGGWPTVVFVRTGGGGDRPLVDRGPASTATFGMPVVPGTGPAMHFARVGFAGVQIDGPIGGLRNTTNGDEDFLIFNVQNAGALRDNVRQSALELSLLARMLPSLTLSTPDCPGTSGTQRIDAAHLALMGHSMGSWIAPLTLSIERGYGAGIFSGAGASYVANIMDKLKPLDVRPYAELLLGFDQDQRTLEAHDPALMIVQWAAEPSDPQVYDRVIVREPPSGAAATHLLMLQGIVDHYILPSIANATSLALGLDVAGPLYDASSAEEQQLAQPPIAPLLPLVAAQQLSLPASANIGHTTTALLIQHPGDMIEDGHEVVFQTDPPKHQYRCFLSSWLQGSPRVPGDGAADDPCN